uniref:Osiris 21 n=1 Tax=Glossina brevipalpis TaxID=37001 RepID=A0A1A9WZ54_9MUSC
MYRIKNQNYCITMSNVTVSMKLRCLLLLLCFVLNNLQTVQSLQRRHRLSSSSSSLSSSSSTSSSSPSPSSPSSASINAHRARSITRSSWPRTELRLIRKVYDDCYNKNNFIDCLKHKALNGLTRAVNLDFIKIMDGVVLEKQNDTEKQSIIPILTDARSFNSLTPIDQALISKIDKLARTHSLKVDMSMGRGHDDGGDGGGDIKDKDKGSHGVKYVIAALLTAMGIAGPIGLKALAAIAGKALVISKVALTIASIIALKKLFSHDHHEETSVQVHAGDHNRRSTYVIRPLQKTNTAGIGMTDAHYADPYRYYYEYH